MTRMGVILGTAAYMSPEQARGGVADKRADIWGFGVVLYEMVTGKLLFAGETVSDTLALVITRQPEWDGVPSQVQRLLRGCLEKDPKLRLRDIGDARLLLQDTSASTHSVEGWRSRRLAWTIAALSIISSAVLGWIHFGEAPPAPDRSVRFQLVPPERSTTGIFRLSPDGRYLAMIASEAGRTRLWVQRLDSLDGQFLVGTDGAHSPFWSPDSTSIGFVAQAKLKRVSVMGGPPEVLCEASFSTRGTWGRSGVIILATDRAALQRVPATGGEPAAITTPGPGEIHRVPAFLPDGRRFQFTVVGGKPEANGIFAASLDGTPVVRLLPDQTSAAYVPPAAARGSGHLLFTRDNTLMAQPFDADRLRMVGEIFPVADKSAFSARRLRTHFLHRRRECWHLVMGLAQRSPSWSGWTGAASRSRRPPRWVCIRISSWHPMTRGLPSIAPRGQTDRRFGYMTCSAASRFS